MKTPIFLPMLDSIYAKNYLNEQNHKALNYEEHMILALMIVLSKSRRVMLQLNELTDNPRVIAHLHKH